MPCFSRISSVFEFYFSYFLDPKMAQLVCSPWYNICFRIFVVVVVVFFFFK